MSSYGTGLTEAGCDEAGRGCLAGPVFAAAVIFPSDYHNNLLNDSKKLSPQKRAILRLQIVRDAIAYGIGEASHQEIDAINILKASWLAMERAIKKLEIAPEVLLIDGNRFKTSLDIPYHCIVKGDGKLLSIAAASILAKTERDDFMQFLHKEYPYYGWDQNKGYPTETHRKAIIKYGISPWHRKSFQLYPQLTLF
ncbi:MAG: ribonuclease HII [Bacteroidales bacterium]|jgi:ribonuclease HII|nr:ribonuclease HII [Bacteroidales bacterium]